MSDEIEKIDKPAAEWRELLSQESHAVGPVPGSDRAARLERVEPQEKREGTFICAACNLPLFEASTKYESGTGWPSFFDAIPGRVGTKTDFKLILPRTEYHCARCGGHQGHVFKDGPQPTGQRYCNNGVALRFVPAGEELPPLRS